MQFKTAQPGPTQTEGEHSTAVTITAKPRPRLRAVPPLTTRGPSRSAVGGATALYVTSDSEARSAVSQSQDGFLLIGWDQI